MTFDEFLTLYQDVPLIESSTFELLCDDPAQLRVQVRGWQRKGYLHALKRGTYVLDERYRRAPVSAQFVANYLVVPSYLSLEYALSHYGLLPEAARACTSVTTKSTRRFSNLLGTFTYRTVKRPLFFGFRPVRDESAECLLAEPEKALLDYLHLGSRWLEESAAQMAALRLQGLDRLDRDRLLAWAGRFPAKVGRLAGIVCNLAENRL
jgi:hypothetical protein